MTQQDKSRVRIQLPRDTLENWKKNTSFIPKLAEPFLVTDKLWLFTGDGVTLAADLVNSPELAYHAGGASEDLTEIEAAIAEIQEQIADLQYTPIEITSFARIGSGLQEVGSTLEEATFTCVFNKTPTVIYFNGEDITTLDNVSVTADDTGLRYTIVQSNIDITPTEVQTITWRLSASDEREHVTATKTATVTFCHGLYYGLYPQGEALDDTLIYSLTRKLSTSLALTFTVNAGASEHIAYALPVSYGTPNFKDVATTLGAAFYLAAESVSFENESGTSVPYAIWLSTNPGLGTTTISVSLKHDF